jgi:hypothetical protein
MNKNDLSMKDSGSAGNQSSHIRHIIDIEKANVPPDGRAALSHS